jgi:hypothetical protein
MKLYYISIIHPVQWVGCGLDNRGIAVGFLEWVTDFSLRLYGCTDSRSCVASYPLGTEESLLRWEGRGWEDYDSPTSNLHIHKWSTISTPPYLQTLRSIYIPEGQAQVEFCALLHLVFFHS